MAGTTDETGKLLALLIKMIPRTQTMDMKTSEPVDDLACTRVVFKVVILTSNESKIAMVTLTEGT